MALAAALFISALLTGCSIDTAFRQATRPLFMSIAVTYGDGRSDVIVRYSVPPPRPGKVYIMWVYTKGRPEFPAGIYPSRQFVLQYGPRSLSAAGSL